MDLGGTLNLTLDSLDPEYDYLDYYNGSFEGPCETVQNRSLALMLGPYVHSVICVLGLIGNCLMLLPLCCAPKPSITQVLLLHLALADLVIVLVLPGLVVMDLGAWSDGGAGCKVLRGGYSVSLYSAALLLAAVSADRYAAVVHARRRLRARSQMPRLLLCAFVWFFAILLSLPNFIFYERYLPQHHMWMGHQDLESGGGFNLTMDTDYNMTGDQPTPSSLRDSSSYDPAPLVCALRFPNSEMARLVKIMLPVMQIAVGFVIPLLVMCFCYGSIVVTLLRGRHLSGKGRGFRRERAVRLVLLVALVFVLCHAPFNVVLLWHTLNTHFQIILPLSLLTSHLQFVDRLEMALALTQTMALLHCVLNPLLYGFNSAPFRTRFYSVLHKLRPQRRLSSTSHSERSTHYTL
uniref:G-protein coupled receptors family 1 profile domain-containing protein n=1 Tax=Periophthalmus magnuspinnatus TaxID=409849 RepID=A0A3B3ZDU9_9GOBI